MDKHSEVEAKFLANGVTVQALMQYITDNNLRLQLHTYKQVEGWDAYYRQGDNMVRHRCDGRRGTSVLTCKKRKSDDSLADRHEVDMYIREDLKAPDVAAFLKMAGFEHFFTIEKCSYIWHVRGLGAEVCIALYMVWGDSKSRHEDAWFLEVEIEKDNNFSQAEANAALRLWIDELTTAFNLQAPLNGSLFEMYAPPCLRSHVVTGSGAQPPCKMHFMHAGECKVQ